MRLLLILVVAGLPVSPTFGLSCTESAAFHLPIQTADVLSSNYALSRPGVGEANPLHGDGNTLRMIAVKVPITIGLIGLDCHISRRSKTTVWIARGALFLGYAIIVRHNLTRGR